MTLFQADRSRLYPQFETYRLHSLSPNDDVLGFPLPYDGATQSRLEHGNHTLSFKETRDRIGWDHLAVDPTGRGLYVDKNWTIVGFYLQDDLTPVFSNLGSLPQPISSKSGPAPEYPSITPLQPNYWAIASGSGSLHVLHTSDDHLTGTLSSEWAIPGEPACPFLIRASHVISETDARLLLSRSIPDPEDESKGKGRSLKRVFELLEVSLDPMKVGGENGVNELDIKWTLRGGDLPIHCTWTKGGWMVLSGETYGPIIPEGTEGMNEVEKEKRERDMRIGKLGLGASLPESTTEPPPKSGPATIAPIPDQPLTWTQTGDSASIKIQFSPGTFRSDFIIILSPTSFSLTLTSASDQPVPLHQFLQYPERSWWAEIDPSLSSFSFDTSTSTLDIDITKIDANHRWPSLFLPSDEDDEDSDIPETLTADTIASVRESFNNIRTRQPDEPEGNHPAIPSLLREEMDFDMEDGEDFEDRAAGAMGDGSGKVGRDVFVGLLKNGESSWSKTSTTVISLPIQSGGAEEGIMIKSAVDGLLFIPKEGSDPIKTPWIHRSTTPALAFVLSSKRDIRLVRHLTLPSSTSEISHPTVLALDSGSSSAGQGNLYVYYPPIDALTAKQGVVGVSGLERGAALGLARIRREGKGRDLVVVLCEKELVVLKNVV